MSRADDLRADYDRLGELLNKVGMDQVNAAAAIARERRMIGELLEALETPEEVPLVDQLAARRGTRTGAAGSASRRRKSG